MSAEPRLELVTVDDAAKLLNISRRAVYNLADRGIVPHVRLGRTLRFDRVTLEAWIRRQLDQPQSKKEPETHGETPGRDLVRRLLGDGPGNGRPPEIPAVSWEGGPEQARGNGGRAQDPGGAPQATNRTRGTRARA
ncbi:MAG TPA: helix-turn-helix domain-containing protein [Polyangiaceae bacterium]|nr:helix-turn-helix domain-containing protein [Polyangiaceae bacterium]